MSKSFVAFTDWRKAIASQPDAIRLEILEAIFDYGETGEVPEFSHDISAALFGFIRLDMDRNNEKRERVREARSAAGKRGGRPRKNVEAVAEESEENQTETKKANVFFEKQDKANKTSENKKSLNVNGNGNVNGNVNPQPPTPLKGDGGEGESPKSERQQIRESARRVLSAYPNQSGGLSMTVQEIWVRDRLWEHEAEILDAIELWKASEQWQKEGGRYVPNFTGFIEREIWRFKPPEGKSHSSTAIGDESGFNALFPPRKEGETEVEYLRRCGFDAY